MRSIETRRKRGTVSTLSLSSKTPGEVPPDVADCLGKTPLERQIDDIVWKWKAGQKKFREDYRWLLNQSNRKDAIRILKKADRLLKRLTDWLRTDPRVPTIIVKDLKHGNWAQMKVTDYLASGGIEWVAGWLSEIDAKGGRPPEAMIAKCAEELAELFKKETGQSKWERVGKIVAKAFPEGLPKDDGARDYRLWIYNIVKRNRERRGRFLKAREK